MKKAYSKPQIMYEDFSLSTNIAGDCEKRTNTPNSGTCGVSYGPYVVFLDTMGSCTLKAGTDDGEWNGFCYHVVTNGQNLFNS